MEKNNDWMYFLLSVYLSALRPGRANQHQLPLVPLSALLVLGQEGRAIAIVYTLALQLTFDFAVGHHQPVIIISERPVSIDFESGHRKGQCLTKLTDSPLQSVKPSYFIFLKLPI